MKLKNVLPLLIFTLIFNCSSDSDSNDDNPGGDPDTTLIKQIVYNSVNDDPYTETFNYDGNRLLSITDVSPASDEIDSATFEYENNRLSKISYFEDNTFLESITVSYDANNMLSNLEIILPEVSNTPFNYSVTHNNDGTLTIGESDYIVQNGNTIEERDSSRILSYQYDTKNSIYKNILDIETIILVNSRAEYGFDIYGASNNHTEVSDAQTSFPTDIDRFEYTYNSNDYPNTAINYYNDELTYNIEYIYE